MGSMRLQILLGAALIALAVPLWALAQNQGTQIAFGAKKQDPSTPVQVTSDQLTVNQTEGTALFTGNVVVIQGDLKMTAPKVLVDYTKGNGAQKGQISRVHASDGVTLTDGIEDAEGKDAVYTVESGKVVMTGDVIVTQGQNATSGQRLDIDLRSGQGVMQGRVQTVFKPAQTTSTGPDQKP